MNEVFEKTRELGEAILRSEEYTTISLELDAYQSKMREITEVAELTKARERFSALVNQVNQVLRFLITGEIGDNKECTGSCESCGSQCRTLH